MGDCSVAKYGEDRYNEIKDEMINMLVKVGWKRPFVKKRVPILPISGWIGDNLLKKSDKMAWWKGQTVMVKKKKILIECLLDALEKMAKPPVRILDKPVRMPVNGVYKIKGVGDVITGRVE